MNKTMALALAAAVVAALGAGYWLGGQRAGQVVTTAQTPSAAKPATRERKILFYRNPMGLPDTSPVPKKDQMGMDYIPVYEGEEANEPGQARQVRISSEKIQQLGVRSEAATLRSLSRSVHAVGRIEIDERLSHTVAPKFEGWIDKLYVNTTGQEVKRGQPLMDVYSPDLVSAQNEYFIARQGETSLRHATPEAQESMKQLAEASLARLNNWDISAGQLQDLSKSGNARRTLTFRAPVNGIVIEKKAVQGMRFMPGDVLYQIADLSSVWIVADVFEQDLALVRPGENARAMLNAYPGKAFSARVSYVYPTLNPQTRTVPVRLELANPGGLLKPGMYADVELSTPAGGKVLTVPASAVIYSGKNQTVLVELAPGRFEPRPVKLGMQGGDYVEVLEGLTESEKVVVSANFLIDSESNLKAAFSGMSGSQAKPAAPPEHNGH
ncbi:cation efflux system protein [Sulfurimicrobium lacus]|uniref:Cation efflux system protein n=1 Tax=Sulfurimicrobium lacus TaxID=2715678 RepID=A0A6F8VCS5_9PROT|nr:efflux RND transporter periplasmic adaptor subunit [Sulfurimicrobium lacus]BCB27140.1 cation efflux system protein [Sulfurimicrobium lacus]